jgi:hypothetical protein
MRGIGPFVAEKYLVIVKKRNELARLLGYQDFYDYKVWEEEGTFWGHVGRKKVFLVYIHTYRGMQGGGKRSLVRCSQP